MEEAKRGILESRAVNRAQDDYLAQGWIDFLATNRTYAFSAAFEKGVEKLTVEDVNKALRRMIDPESVTFVLAGDKSKAEKAGKAF